MDPVALLKMLAPALLVAIGISFALMAGGMLIPRRGGVAALRRAVMPMAIAAGFVAGYSMWFSFPAGSEEHAWFLGPEAWKMSVMAGILAGFFLGAVAIMPRWIGVATYVIFVVAVTLLLVRGPWVPTDVAWEDWGSLGGGLLVTLLLYGAAFVPAAEGKLWLLGPLVAWLPCSTAAVVVMAWQDQNLGHLFILLAVLAGLAAVAGMVRPLRDLAGNAGTVIGVLFAVLVMLAARYRSDLPLSIFVWLAAAPLGAAAAWVPALRRRPAICIVVAVVIVLAVLAPGVWIAHVHAPSFDDAG